MTAKNSKSLFKDWEIVKKHFSDTVARQIEIESCATTQNEALFQLFQQGQIVVLSSALYRN